MDKRQKSILAEFLTVIAVTVLAVVGMLNFKDYVNRSEAIKAMRVMSEKIAAYRQENAILPPEGYIEKIREDSTGGARVGRLQYRGFFVDPRSEPNTILLFSEKQYDSSFLDNGYIVLFLDGSVEWVDTRTFEKMLAEQRTDFEIQMSD